MSPKTSLISSKIQTISFDFSSEFLLLPLIQHIQEISLQMSQLFLRLALIFPFIALHRVIFGSVKANPYFTLDIRSAVQQGNSLFQIFFFVALYKLSWQQAMLVRHSGPQQIAVAFKCELLSVLHQQGFLMLKKALVIQTASVKMQDFHCLSSPAQDAFAEALTQTYKLSCYLGAWFWRMS